MALILATSFFTKLSGAGAGAGAFFAVFPPNFTKAAWAGESTSESYLISRASMLTAWVVTARKATVAKKALSILRFVVSF